MSSWKQGAARELLQKQLLQCHHCTNCHAARGWQSNVIFHSSPAAALVNCCIQLSSSATRHGQGTSPNMAAAMLPLCQFLHCQGAAGSVTHIPFLLLQLHPVDCCFQLVLLGNMAWQGGFFKYGCCNAATAPTAMLPGNNRVMPFFLFLLWLHPS